jgi:tagaturonate reductase
MQFIGKFLKDAIFNEVNPTLGLDEKELKDFAEEVFDRFRNPLSSIIRQVLLYILYLNLK